MYSSFSSHCIEKDSYMPIIFHFLFKSIFYVCFAYLCILIWFIQRCLLQCDSLFIGICCLPFGRDFSAIFGVFEDYLYFILRHRQFPRFIASVIGKWVWSVGEGAMTAKNRSSRRKSVSLSLHPPQILRGLSQDRLWDCAVKNHRPTACSASYIFRQRLSCFLEQRTVFFD